jgi:hypothetical protein
MVKKMMMILCLLLKLKLLCGGQARPGLADLGGVWFGVLKFNKHCSTFVLFDKKFSILD